MNLETTLSTSSSHLGQVSAPTTASWGERAVQLITASSGLRYAIPVALFTLAMAGGAWATRVVDHRYGQEKNFTCYNREIFRLTLGVPVAALVALTLVAAVVSHQFMLVFPLLAVGFVVGLKAMDHHINHSDRRIDQFIQVYEAHRSSSLRFELREYLDYLRCCDLKKLCDKIRHRGFGFGVLDFSNSEVTDLDLERLATAGWFNRSKRIIMRDCQQITAKGLIEIGKAGLNLDQLDLDRTSLTDDDLKQLAESGCFSKLPHLSIQDNSRITAKGLAWIGKQGFDALKRLNIGSNHQLLQEERVDPKEMIDQWIKQPGFDHLEILEMTGMNTTEDILKYLLDKADWFQKLQGIDLSHNNLLISLPDNMDLFQNLSKLQVSDTSGGGNFYYKGGGLVLFACKNLDLSDKKSKAWIWVLEHIQNGTAYVSPTSW